LATKGRSASSATSRTRTPNGPRLRRASSTLGDHDSVVARSEGRRRAWPSTSAKTSPPPVWTSRAASAVPIRSTSIRAYPHEGRSSVALPSNQEKSQPSTGTAAPSAMSSSNPMDPGCMGGPTASNLRRPQICAAGRVPYPPCRRRTGRSDVESLPTRSRRSAGGSVSRCQVGGSRRPGGGAA